MSSLIPLTEYGPLDGGNFEYHWSGRGVDIHLLSDVGRKRRNNEDSCILCAPQKEDVASSHGVLFAVADGMGGASAGEYASRMALQVLVRTYFNNDCESAPLALQEALQIANGRLFEEAELNPVYAGMGTTVCAAVLLGDWVYIAHVGDSRLYLLRERSGIHQVTLDHSLVEEQVRSGLISPAEARNHSLKNLITRAVGIKETVKVDLYALHVQQGDTLLICSDGLTNMITDPEIASCLANGNLVEGTRNMVERALMAGGTDNTTAITLRLNETPPRSIFQDGAEEVRIASSGFFGRLKRLFR
jgi:protein phosphatase